MTGGWEQNEGRKGCMEGGGVLSGLGRVSWRGREEGQAS